MKRFLNRGRRGSTLVAVLAAMAVVLLMLAGMLKIGLVGRRHLLKELEVRQAECLLEAAADRAAARLSADAAWPGDLRTVSADEIVGSGPAEVTTEIAAAGQGSRSIHIVVDYPAGRADSVRRERVFPFTSFPGTSPPASDPVPPIQPSPEDSQ